MKLLALLTITVFSTSCAEDPLLKAMTVKEADERASKSVVITNESDHDVNVCAYYSECFFSVAPGETKSGTIKYMNYGNEAEKNAETYVGISLESDSFRKIAKYDRSWDTLFTEAGSEFRWAGNFSGVHSFIVSDELADLVTDEHSLNTDSYSWSRGYGRFNTDALRKMTLALSNLDHQIAVGTDYDSRLEITGFQQDSVLYLGRESGSTSSQDKKEGHTFQKDGWTYTRMQASESNKLFNAYTTSSRFVCRNGGCFEQ